MTSRQRHGTGPHALADVLGELFLARGYGRARSAADLERAWEQVSGASLSGLTRVVGLRRGVLTVAVAHPALLDELMGFRRRELLQGLQASLPERGIRELRMQVESGPSDASDAGG